MPKLIAVDLDGTLLNSRLHVTADTISAIAECESRGHRFAFCSGRNLLELNAVAPIMPYFRYAIISTGAYIVDLEKHQLMDEKTISIETVLELYKAVEHRFDLLFEICYEDKVFAPSCCQKRLTAYGIGSLAPMFLHTRTAFDNICEALIQYGRPPGKVNMFFTSREQRDMGMEAIRSFDLSICSQNPQNIEINARGIDKGTALARLSDQIGFLAEDIVAIGDNNNDLSMLRFAGTSIAMGNASDAIKRQTNHVTLTNDQDGVAFALRHYLDS